MAKLTIYEGQNTIQQSATPQTSTLALPFSKYSGNKAHGNTINLNLYVIVALLRRFFTSGSILGLLNL